MPKFSFIVGHAYPRKEVIAIAGDVPEQEGGTWFTGLHSYGGAHFIFCGIGMPGRTGHDYGNYFDGDDLDWSGATASHADQPRIRNITAPAAEVHIFYRNEERAAFTYAGLGIAISVSTSTPVRVLWRFAPASPETSAPAASVGKLMEGKQGTKYVKTYERNPQARADCLAHHGAVCKVCTFDFGAIYGPMGQGYMHVHHLRPISTTDGEAEVNPITDLAPVCPNCHAMLHRRKPPYAVDELRHLMKAA